MSASTPPPSLAAVRKLRPWYLLLAMTTTGFVGLLGALTNLDLAKQLKSGVTPDLGEALTQAQQVSSAFVYLLDVKAAAVPQAMAQIASRAFPLSVAQVILCSLLFIASSAAMSGRRGARGLALQAVLAVAALNIVEYLLTKGARGAAIEAATRASASLPSGINRQFIPLPETWWWLDRIHLAVIGLGPLLLAALALTRPRTKAFFEATARFNDATSDDDS